MKFNSFLKPFLFAITVVFFISCDKDFNEIGADFVDNDHYNFTTQKYDVVAYNQSLGPVQTSNLPTNSLGYYNNPVFGRTKASFVTQLELASVNPTFINNPSSIQVDSVYLYVPYFSHQTSTLDADGINEYLLDSIYGAGKIKLEVFRNNFYLRNLDANPISGLLEQQNYFSDQKSDIEAVTPTTAPFRLNNRTDNDGLYQNDNFEFKNTPIKFYKTDTAGNLITPLVVRERLAPGIYMDLDTLTFKAAVLQAGASNLIDNNAFKNYFRGLYFKVSSHPDNPTEAALSLINFAQGKIVIVYKDATSTTVATPIRKTMTLNMKGYTVNLLENTSNGSLANNLYNTTLTNANSSTGDSKLYLKGGAGSMAIIDLFDGQKNNSVTALNTMRNENWLINEANLIFTIYNDPTLGMGAIPDADIKKQEPNRIYLYDFTNKRPLIDYYFDSSTNINPKFNKLIHSGIVQKVSVNARGTRYKIRITNYLRNLVKYGGAKTSDGITLDPSKDSTNVKLGLVVTENINSVANARVKSPFTYTQKNRITGNSETKTAKYIPAMSIINPLGTVLYGSNIPSTDQDYDKRLQLEIIYTKPD